MNCQAFFCIFYVLFTLCTPFLLLFSFPMKVSNLFLRIFYVLFTLFSSPFFLSNELSSFFWHFLRTFYALYAFSSPFFLSNESVQPCPTFFYVLFTLFTPFLLLFSFPMKVSNLFLRIFYVLFTLFTPFLLLSSFPMNCQAFFCVLLRPFYVFYAFLVCPFQWKCKVFSAFFYVLFTLFTPF